MIADFIQIKNKILKDLKDQMIERIKNGSFLMREIKSKTIHEGQADSYQSFDGKKRKYEMKLFSESIAIDEPGKITYPDLIEKFIAMADSFILQNEQYFYNQMNKVTGETGNNINHKEPTFEAYVEALQKIYMSFDVFTGEPHLPQMIMSPQMYEKMKEKENSITPKEKEEHEKIIKSIINQKKDEFFSKFNSRTLVD